VNNETDASPAPVHRMVGPESGWHTNVAPIGTIIHLSGGHGGSSLKINHRTDVPASLMVRHFAERVPALPSPPNATDQGAKP
jgi:hypothetical protein